MSTTVDERVVQMRFRNENFEKEANKTIQTLAKLKTSSDLSGAGKGLETLSASLKNIGNNTSFTNISNGLETVKVQFSALQTISDTVWRSITNGAINTAKKMMSVMNAPINQIKEGGKNRALNIEQAKFQLEGLGVTWASIEEDINYGVQDTAYGLDSAAKAAAQLVASQVSLGEDMKTALRGISGVAAMTNSEYDDIAHIFTTVAGNGRLMGEQLQQLSGRGLNAAASLGKYLGKSEAEIREMVSKGKISFEVFSKAMDETFGDHAKDANKTFTGALSNTKAALSRLGADVATSGFESLRQMMVATIPVLKSLKTQLGPVYTALSEGMNDLTSVVVVGLKRINKMVDSSEFGNFLKNIASKVTTSTNRLYKGFKQFVDLGGVEHILTGICNIFEALNQIIRPIKIGFKDIFPNSFLDNLAIIAMRFENFTKKLWLTVDAQQGVRIIAQKLASGLMKIIEVVKAVGRIFKSVIGDIRDFVVALLEYVGMPEFHDNPLEWLFNSKIVKFITDKFIPAIQKIYDKLVHLDELFFKIKRSIKEAFNKDNLELDADKELFTFESIVDVFEWLKEQATKVKDIFSGIFAVMSEKPAKNNIFSVIKNALASSEGLPMIERLKAIITGIKNEYEELKGPIETAEKIFKPLIDLFNKAGEKIIGLLKTLKPTDYALIALVASFISVNSSVKKLIKNFAKLPNMVEGFFNLFKNVKQKGLLKSTLDNLLDPFIKLREKSEKQLKMQIFVNNMTKISASILMLAASLKLISTIDSWSLLRGVGVITLFIGVLMKLSEQLAISLSGFEMKNFTKISGMLLLLSVSVALLANSLKKVSSIGNIGVILSSILAIIGMMGSLALIAYLLSTQVETMSKGATLLIIFAASIKILADAVYKLATADQAGIKMALLTVYSLMGVLTGFTLVLANLAPELSKGAGVLLAFSASIYILSSSVKKLADLKIEDITQGLTAIMLLMGSMFGVILLLSVLVKNDLPKIALAIIAFATSVYILSNSLAKISSIDPNNLQNSMLALGTIALGMMVVATVLSNLKDLPKVTLAILGFAVCIEILSNALVKISSIKTEKLYNSFVTLSGIVALMLVVTYTLSKLNDIGKVALAIVTFATSVVILAAALRIVAGIDSDKLAGTTIALIAVMVSLAAVIALLDGLKVSINTITAIATMGTVVIMLAKGLDILASALVKVAGIPWESLKSAGAALAVGLAAFVAVAALAAVAGSSLLVGAIGVAAFGIAMGLCVIPIILLTAAISGFILLLPKMIEALTNTVLAFKEFMVTVKDNAFAIGEAAGEMGFNFIAGFISGIEKGKLNLLNAIIETAKNIIDWFKEKLHINSPSKDGISIGGYFIDGITQGLKEKLNNINIVAGDIAKGLINGLKEKLKDIKFAAKELGSVFINSFKKVLDINSPSEVMRKLATFVIAGFSSGIDDGESDVEESALTMKNTLLDAFGNENISPTITPVLDLSQIKSGAGMLNGMLSNGSYAVEAAARLTASNANQVDNAKTNNEYRELVFELRNLRNDVVTLGNKVNNLKVYMNTNALVGQIAPAINQKLGTSYNRSARATGTKKAAIKKRYG